MFLNEMFPLLHFFFKGGPSNMPLCNYKLLFDSFLTNSTFSSVLFICFSQARCHLIMRSFEKQTPCATDCQSSAP